jgi:hypothetical protein
MPGACIITGLPLTAVTIIELVLNRLFFGIHDILIISWAFWFLF